MSTNQFQIYKDQIQGLKNSISTLREIERLFVRSSTLQEQEEKARSAGDKLEEKLEETKEKKASLKAQRAEILKSALGPLADAISALLPRGQAVISLDEKLFIGWQDGERLIPYAGLSGGEKVFYDSALANGLLQGLGMQKILVIEAAELDQENFNKTLGAITKAHPDAQIIVSTCHDPGKVPEGWRIFKFG